MRNYMTRSKAAEQLATQETHCDPHAGHDVVKLPTHDDIAAVAYAIYLRGGSVPGRCEQNWVQAEDVLRAGDRSS
jgi:hypothetical protein